MLRPDCRLSYAYSLVEVPQPIPEPALGNRLSRDTTQVSTEPKQSRAELHNATQHDSDKCSRIEFEMLLWRLCLPCVQTATASTINWIPTAIRKLISAWLASAQEGWQKSSAQPQTEPVAAAAKCQANNNSSSNIGSQERQKHKYIHTQRHVQRAHLHTYSSRQANCAQWYNDMTIIK